MRVLSLTLLYGMLNVFSAGPALKFPSSSATTILQPVTTQSKTTEVAGGLTNLIFQSTDGGQTWQDVSSTLPGYGEPEGFYAGESELYLRFNDELYHSKKDGRSPVWEKEEGMDMRGFSIAFHRSGVIAYKRDGQIYQKTSTAGTWLPAYTGFKKQEIETIFETEDGRILIGCRSGLYQSADKGKTWKQVKNEGWVMDIAESNGVLIATGEKGIMRSADQGEHWEWVINEGGVGIDVERIEGGFAAIAYNTTTKSRHIHVSKDDGKTWQAVDKGLRSSSSISSIKQMSPYLIVGHPDGIYRSADRGKTWYSVHYGLGSSLQLGGIFNSAPDQRKVFKIFTSGNVVYAVAGNDGC